MERLYAESRESLLAYYAHRLPNAADAEDFVQAAFERLLAKDPDADLGALLPLIASGLLKNEYRDDECQRDLSYEALVGPDGEGLDHLTQFQSYDFADHEFAEGHDAALRGLDPGPRDAYILGELRGVPSREAGPLLGVSHVTANTRREQATATLRKEIAT